MSKPVFLGVAWPYASGSRHVGHLAGAYLPADIFARQQRMVGNEVLMVSGSDAHGTPITVRAEAEKVTPQDIVDRYHAEFVEQFKQLGVSWDLYTTTATQMHKETVQEMFMKHLEAGFIDRRVSEQFFDPEVERFLPDRYVEGTCPTCGYADARGDQCDHCGRTLDPVDLVEPRSKLSGASPILRETEHFYFRFSDFTEQIQQYLATKKGWRSHVINFAAGIAEEGLHDRAITRDITWGIELPVDDLGEGKRIYVWYDAVIGYLSASKEWAQRQGDNEKWRHWWENDDARHVYFVGKDNIPFHALFWPAQLMGEGNLRLPDDLPANQYVTFKGGEKASSSRGVGLTIGEGLEMFDPDALRFALAANFPEHADTDISKTEIARRVNEELVATWGNLVNRVLAMVHKTCDGQIPELGSLESEDKALLAEVDGYFSEASTQFEAVELKAALQTAMKAARAVNTYLNATEPWRVVKENQQRGSDILHTALSAINGVRVLFAPYLPFSASALDAILGEPAGWQRAEITAGTPIAKPTPLFNKIELEEALD